MTQSKTKRTVAAGIALAIVLLLACARLLPQSLDKVVWRFRQAPMHVTIIKYDAAQAPAVGVTLNEERTAELMRQLGNLRGRRAGSGPDTDAAAGYFLRLRSTDYDEYDYFGESEYAIADESGALTVGWGEDKTAAYRLAGEARALCDLCDAYLFPEGGYPGIAFLREFFGIDGDGRWKLWIEAGLSADSRAFSRAIEPYHAGLAPYVTEEILKRIELGRYLFRMESTCKAEADRWDILMIRVDERSVPGSCNFWVDLRSAEEPYVYLTFSGSYQVNKNGLVKNFFIDL